MGPVPAGYQVWLVEWTPPQNATARDYSAWVAGNDVAAYFNDSETAYASSKVVLRRLLDPESDDYLCGDCDDCSATLRTNFLPEWSGLFTLKIKDANGNVVRTLADGVNQSGFLAWLNYPTTVDYAKRQDAWNGKDDGGQFVPVGTYTAAASWLVGQFTYTDEEPIHVVGCPTDSHVRLLLFARADGSSTIGDDLAGGDVDVTGQTVGGKVSVVLEIEVGAASRIARDGQGQLLASAATVRIRDTYPYPDNARAQQDCTVALDQAGGWWELVNAGTPDEDWVETSAPPSADNGASADPRILRTLVTQWDTPTGPGVEYYDEASQTWVGFNPSMGHNGTHAVSLAAIDGDPDTTLIPIQQFDYPTQTWSDPEYAGADPVDADVRNLVVTSIGATHGNIDYLKYIPDPESAFYRPRVSFGFDDHNLDGQSHTYRVWALIQPTKYAGQEFLDLGDIYGYAYAYVRDDSPPTSGQLTWDGSVCTWNEAHTEYTLGDPDEAEWGTYTYDVIVNELDGEGNVVDAFAYKWPYCLTLGDHEIHEEVVRDPDTGEILSAELHGSYTLTDYAQADTYPNAELPSGVALNLVDMALQEKTSLPVEDPQPGVPHADVLLHSTADLEENPHWGWRMVMTGVDHCWTLYRRDYESSRMLAANQRAEYNDGMVIVDGNGRVNYSGTHEGWTKENFEWLKQPLCVVAELHPGTAFFLDVQTVAVGQNDLTSREPSRLEKVAAAAGLLFQALPGARGVWGVTKKFLSFAAKTKIGKWGDDATRVLTAWFRHKGELRWIKQVVNEVPRTWFGIGNVAHGSIEWLVDTVLAGRIPAGMRDDVINAFVSTATNQPRVCTVLDDCYVVRYWGGTSGETGNWLTFTQGARDAARPSRILSPAEARSLMSAPIGNTCNKCTLFKLKKGTKILVGTVKKQTNAAKFHVPNSGGGIQIYLPYGQDALPSVLEKVETVRWIDPAADVVLR
jgi:hypothetical protein